MKRLLVAGASFVAEDRPVGEKVLTSLFFFITLFSVVIVISSYAAGISPR
jgi:hypothetical protein